MLNTSQQVQFTFAADTDVGRLRQGKPNQDSFGTFDLYCSDEAVLAVKGKLFVVADGMGGAAGGKEASTIGVDVVFQSYYADPDLDLRASLQRAIEEANTRIHQHGREHPELRGLGTTIVLALLHGSTLIIGNVGDSRGYLLHQGHLQQLSRDHTSVQDQVRAGLLMPEEALTHPRRHVLSRNLGYRPQAEPEFAVRTLANGDTILLCSDGLSGCIKDDELAIMLRESRGEDAVEALINLANSRGGPDNITALVINIDDARLATDLPTSEPLSQASRQTEPGLTRTPIELAQPVATSARGRRALLPVGQPLIWVLATLAMLLLISALVFRNAATLGEVTGNDTQASEQRLPAAQASPRLAQATVSLSPVADGVIGAPAQVVSVVPALTATTSPTAEPESTAVTQFVTAQPRTTTAAPTPPQRLVLGQFQVSSMALSRDGQLLASGSPDGMIRLWQLPAAALVVEFKADQTAISGLAFSPDGKSLALASTQEQVKLFSIDVITGSAEQTIAMLNEERLSGAPVYGLEVTQNDTLRYVTQQGGWMIVNEQGGISDLPLGQAADGVRSVVFATNGVAVAILREDIIQVVRIGDPTMTRDLPQRDNAVADLAFSQDGHTLLVLQTIGAVECWLVSGDGAELTTDQPRTCKETNTLAIQATTEPALPASTRPVTGGTQPTPTISPMGRSIRVAFSQDGQQLVSVDQTGVIKRWAIVGGGASEISEIPVDN